ncbi:pseudouridine synthase [Inhella gelatinilytica]|uniref:Pseudouridine synthase n=1 Tax=Inhella gelatinilytica TaxID=2795030 RepID=A0A931IY47_9BURK|nr:pseudouridine synthase [Inhella gelatinilytica]MBH9551971.1 pseudouridine synthase [Inhella gelatinilytica]
MKPEPPFQPPPRNGVSASRVRAGVGHAHVLGFLHARFPHINGWRARLLAGEVLDAQGQAVGPDSPCPAGTLLWYWRGSAPEVRVPFEVAVLHQCERLLVVDKPPFLAVAPVGRHVQETVLVRLQQQLGLPHLAPLHRLDRDTAGVLAFAVQPESRGAYQALWRERRVTKVYEAIAPWAEHLSFPLTARHRLVEPQDETFHQMQVQAGEPNCETRVERLHEVDPAQVPGAAPGQRLALYRLTPHTGRKHQLRCQMAALGLPLVNDRVYPVLQPEGPDDFSRPLMLLARRLEFVDPLEGQARGFESLLRLPRLGLAT